MILLKKNGLEIIGMKKVSNKVIFLDIAYLIYTNKKYDR